MEDVTLKVMEMVTVTAMSIARLKTLYDKIKMRLLCLFPVVHHPDPDLGDVFMT